MSRTFEHWLDEEPEPRVSCDCCGRNYRESWMELFTGDGLRTYLCRECCDEPYEPPVTSSGEPLVSPTKDHDG